MTELFCGRMCFDHRPKSCVEIGVLEARELCLVGASMLSLLHLTQLRKATFDV